MKNVWIFITGVVSFIYLLNPTWGAIELIPDVVPVIGNLDEATAMAVLLACLRYFGYDFSGFFGKKNEGHLKPSNGRVVDAG